MRPEKENKIDVGRITEEITMRLRQVFASRRHFLFFVLAVLVLFTSIPYGPGEELALGGNAQAENSGPRGYGDSAKAEKGARVFGPTRAEWYVPNRRHFMMLSRHYQLYPSNIVSKAMTLGDKEFLEMLIDYHLKKAKVEDVKGKLLAVVSPHAGIVWSGQGEAYSYALLKKHKFKKVLVLANSHRRGLFTGAAVLDADYYKTPLGLIKIDCDTCNRLLKEELVISLRQAFIGENSLELQLPFLQRTLGDFLLIPVLIGDLRSNDYEKLASSLRKYIDESTLIAVSCDFTHYGKNYRYTPFPLNEKTRANIEKLDRGAIDRIIALDFDGFWKYHNKTGVTICGRNPTGILLKILSPPVKGKLVHYYTSGDLTGDYASSVSYASILFTRPE